MSTSRAFKAFTAACMVGCSLHTFAATPTWGWSADGLAAGDLTQWAPSSNTTTADINWNGTGTKAGGATNFAAISEWVNSPSYNINNNGGSGDSWAEILGDTTTKQDATWELVFRPGDYTGTHTLFNTGGNGDGTAIVLTGSTIDFRFQDAPDASQRAIASFDLSTLGTADQFYHVVGIADLNNPGIEGTSTLWVNGVERTVASSAAGGGGVGDWDGGDLAELGKGGNIPGGNPFAFDTFDGDVASFNFYGNQILADNVIEDKYNTVASATGLNLIQTTGWTDVAPAQTNAGDYYGTLTSVGAGETGTNAAGAITGAGQHTNVDGDDTIGWAVGDYVLQGNFDATGVTEPALETVLAKMDLFIPAGSSDIDLTLLFNQDMEGTLEPDDVLRIEIYDVVGDSVLSSITFADDPANTNPPGTSNFSYGDTPEILTSLDNTGLTHVQARIIYAGGGWSDGDQEEIQIGDPVFKATFVPEPSSLALLGLGGLLIARRRRA